MTVENAQKMLDKWEATIKSYERWQLKNAGNLRDSEGKKDEYFV